MIFSWEMFFNVALSCQWKAPGQPNLSYTMDYGGEIKRNFQLA